MSRAAATRNTGSISRTPLRSLNANRFKKSNSIISGAKKRPYGPRTTFKWRRGRAETGQGSACRAVPHRLSQNADQSRFYRRRDQTGPWVETLPNQAFASNRPAKVKYGQLSQTPGLIVNLDPVLGNADQVANPKQLLQVSLAGACAR
jgi:hypothetical protein